MGRQIKSLEKDLETFPPAQNENDQFVEKMSISLKFAVLDNTSILFMMKTQQISSWFINSL